MLELLGIKNPIDIVTAEAGGAWGSVRLGDTEVVDEIDGDGLSDDFVKLLCSNALSTVLPEGLNVDDESEMAEFMDVSSTPVDITDVG
jgi:hypothetical protein